MSDVKLKVGDLVVFKKYENMTDEEQSGIIEENFPEFGKVSEVYKVLDDINRFEIEGEPHTFSTGSIKYIISNTDDIHAGDEALIKTTLGETKGDYVWTSCSWISKDDVIGVLKRKEEHFIVQENHYGMYVNGSEVLVVNKDDAKIYNSRDEANDEAAGLHLNAWNVIPYGD